jgi:hypothetical protein
MKRKIILLFMLSLCMGAGIANAQNAYYSGKLVTVASSHQEVAAGVVNLYALEVEGTPYILNIYYMGSEVFAHIPLMIEGVDYQEGDSIEIYGSIFVWSRYDFDGIKVESIRKIADGSPYYWYLNKKIEMEILPTGKYITVNSAEDTLRIKNKLTARGFTVYPFNKPYKESIYYTLVESTEPLPVLTDDEAILYEAPYLTIDNHRVILSHCFYVKLMTQGDVQILEKMAEDTGVEIIGNDEYMPLWYTLSCTKNSKGNALRMANLFYRLFSAAEPELMGGFSITLINNPIAVSPVIIYAEPGFSGNIVIEAKGDFINYLEIFDLTGKAVFSSAYPDATTVHVDKADKKGI